MKKYIYQISVFFVWTFVFSLVFISQLSSANAFEEVDKLKTEDILAGHLKSVGTEEARKSITSIMGEGTAEAISKGANAGRTSGLVVIASAAEKNLIGMRFPNNDYPYEKMGFDGDNFTVGFIRPGLRSTLGEFLLENDKTFKVGILGGVLSNSWELLNYNKKVGKLKCGGTKKMDSVKYYECKYSPRRSALKISMYFHPENFRHVRTEYKRTISGGQGLGIDNSSRQSATRFKMIEMFSDFKEVNGLTLPHSYTITFEKNGRSPRSNREISDDMEWKMKFQKFTFNQSLDKKQFKMDTL